MAIEPVFTSGLSSAEAATIRRAADRGIWERIHPGAYVPRAAWTSASAAERHRVLVTSYLRAHPATVVVTDRSAVAMHGLPWIGPFGSRVIVTDPDRDRGQVKSTVRRRGSAGRVPASTVIDGVVVGTLAETAVDVALHEHPWRAIVVLDAVLRRGIPKDELRAALDERGARGRGRAEVLIDVADGGAESAGESITRWGAHVLGAPAPVLQQEFPYDEVLHDRVDLWYPQQGVIVEFDGRTKYGAGAPDALWDEKRREDRLRRRRGVHGFVRVTWRDAMPAGQLPRLLIDGGVPLGDGWPSAWRLAAHRALE
ncbi:hypothetical protein ACRQ4B_13985 [Curtobacterium sp. SP.BCo]|uniref:hypothetical protein n=1 Tax=Curtobacterium sp. SP.BCo TaxID=3435229 RepID=UPI003F7341B6